MKFFRKDQAKEEVDFAQIRQEQLTKIGENLRVIRQRKNLDLEIIASQIHIPISILNALENGDLNKLPEPVFIKQLLRKYANFLNLQSEEINHLIDNFNTEINHKKDNGFYHRWQPLSIFRIINFSPKNLYILYIILIFLSIKSLSNFLQSSQFITNNQINKLDVIETNNGVDNPSSKSPQAIPAVETKTQEKPPIPESLTLKVSVEDECWVRVIVDGKTVFEGILNEGLEKEWTAQEKLTIRAGNAGGLAFTLNEGQTKKLGELGQVEEVTFELPKRS